MHLTAITIYSDMFQCYTCISQFSMAVTEKILYLARK